MTCIDTHLRNIVDALKWEYVALMNNIAVTRSADTTMEDLANELGSELLALYMLECIRLAGDEDNQGTLFLLAPSSFRKFNELLVQWWHESGMGMYNPRELRELARKHTK